MNKLLAGLMSVLCITGAAQAQSNDWPNQKVIKLIAVFPPGGSVDQVARILAPTLQTQLKQNVIVENIGGASGSIGAAAVAKAQPDGYTFGVVFDTHGVNENMIESINERELKYKKQQSSPMIENKKEEASLKLSLQKIKIGLEKGYH